MRNTSRASAPPSKPLVPPVRQRTASQVLRDLKTQLKHRPPCSPRHFGWTVEVSGMTDDALDEVVAMLSRRGYRATYARELQDFAHFTLVW